MVSSIEGVNVERVSEWLEMHVGGATAPFDFDVIGGGHSNLTFRVTDSVGGQYVLRRPPLAHGLASAHDMAREHRIISALNRSKVPVPAARGLCEDDSVNGAPFYVMDFVDGHVLRTTEDANRHLSETARRRASESIAETLSTIHAVDLDNVGLSTLGKHEDYIARQLRRWYGQWQQQRTRELPLVDRVHDELVRRIPAQGPATIVHGDYRLDNTMVTSEGDVCAVLDWEICTLGDPLADVAMLSVYWTGPTDTTSAWDAGATTAPGFLNRDDLVEHYASVSGRDLGDFTTYLAFANWKLACILEGVYARYVGGALGERSMEELEPFARQVEAAAVAAAALLDR